MAARPLSPHLSVYRFAYTMALSILHRITGVALAAGLIVNAVSPTALRFAPPLNVSESELTEAVDILDAVLRSHLAEELS